MPRRNTKNKEPTDLLFFGSNSGRVVAVNFRRPVDWAMIRTEVKRPDLRHTFVPILFDARASAPDVQAVLGHSSLQVTECYSRTREGIARRAAAVFDILTNDSGYGTDAARHHDVPHL